LPQCAIQITKFNAMLRSEPVATAKIGKVKIHGPVLARAAERLKSAEIDYRILGGIECSEDSRRDRDIDAVEAREYGDG
jgi:hypothetical protein